MNNSPHPYEQLTPDTILDAIESQGYETNGHLLALNSYENRVYQIGINERDFIIAKFYRPDRWSHAAILEEHQFALELARQEIPVIAPLENQQQQTLHEAGGFRFSLFPRVGGHWPDLTTTAQREQMGRLLGRMHAVGACQAFQHRQHFTLDIARNAVAFLSDEQQIPDYLIPAYSSLSEELLATMESIFDQVGQLASIRLHGDCHPGNILWSEHDGPQFVDLDDTCSGPAIQDLWMLLSGTPDEMQGQLQDLLNGYTQFHDFSYGSLALIETLRTIRIMHYAAWLARRWPGSGLSCRLSLV